MGGYYVPNIQRPGFGYQRRSEDDEDEFGDPSDWGGGGGGATPASDGTDASSATGGYSPLAVNSPARGMRSMSATTPVVQNPEYWPSGMDWGSSSLQGNSPYAQSDLSDSYGTPSRGGAGTAPTNTEMNLAEPPVPQQQDAEIPTGTNVPGIGQPPMGRPSRVPPPVSSHAEQEKLKQLIKQGPKRSILGTIAAGAAGFGVGYVNAAGRTRNPIPVPTQAMRNMTWRAPGGGAWDTKLARQQQLAEQEQGEEKRTLAAQQLQAQAEERQAQADYYRQHGTYLGQTAATAAKAEEDRQRDRQWLNITRFIGRDGQVADLQPDGSLPAGKGWTKRNDPDHPGKFIAVRPNPGTPVDRDTAELLGIPYSEEGTYVPSSTVNAGVRAKISAANAAQAASDREASRLRQEAADRERGEYHQGLLSLGAGNAEDRAEANRQRQEAAQQKMSDAIDAARERELTSAKVWANNARNKKVAVGGIVTAAEEAEIAREELRQSQAAYDRWGHAIRRRPGGTAADFTVHPDGSVEQATEAYGAGGKGAPLAGGPTPTPKTPAPTTPTGGGRGGRGNVPPPVKTTAGGQPPPPPPEAVKRMKTGVETGFGNGQTWRKEADGSLTYLGQAANN